MAPLLPSRPPSRWRRLWRWLKRRRLRQLRRARWHRSPWYRLRRSWLKTQVRWTRVWRGKRRDPRRGRRGWAQPAWRHQRLSRRLRAGASAWVISAVAHAIALALSLMIIYTVAVDEPQAAIDVSVATIAYEKPMMDRDVDLEIDLDPDIVTVEPELSLDLSEPDDPSDFATETEQEIDELPVQGREDAQAVVEMAGVEALMSIGASGGASGAFGNRQAGRKQRALSRFGGNQASENAVDAALRWFMRHQSSNGCWDPTTHHRQCTERGPKVERGKIKDARSKVGCTGLILLCYLGAGYDHQHASRYQDTIALGLKWLRNYFQTTPTADNYGIAIGTMALAEAYAMTNDPALREATLIGVKILRRHQGVFRKRSYAWNYKANNRAGRNDASVSGWCVMALKSAKVAGLDIGTSMDGAKRWLTAAWEASNPEHARFTSSDQSSIPYQWGLGHRSSHNSNLYGVGASCALFLGLKPGDIMLDTLMNRTVAKTPTTSQKCLQQIYYTYYGTLAAFQYGGDAWASWNARVRDQLVTSQDQEPGCRHGSWRNATGYGTGRLLGTALCTLSLEVYYRYLPVSLQGGPRPR